MDVASTIKKGIKSSKLIEVQHAYDDRAWLDSNLDYHYLVDLRTKRSRKCFPIFSFIGMCEEYNVEPGEFRKKFVEKYTLPTISEIISRYKHLTN